MSQSLMAPAPAPLPFSPPHGSRLARAFRRAVLTRLGRLAHGRIELVDPFGRAVLGAEGARLRARVEVFDAAFYRRTVLGGAVGASESWMRGEWRCDALAALVEMLALDATSGAALESGPARIAESARRLLHALRRNHRSGSRRNIAAHYDLGNDFFAAFLDPTLTYSCAVFEEPGASLEAAQRAKYERLCRKLALRPGDHLLEIGSGWGGFALHAAAHHGCRVTTTTISRAQHEVASERIAAAGLADRVTVLLEDYRDLRGRYDRLVSIEMIEAVGHEHLDAYFRTCSERLAADGRMALQAIVIAEHAYEAARRHVDFIKRWVFPGGHLPSVAAMAGAVARATDLRFAHLEELTSHYVETLRRWGQRFAAERPAIGRLGYDERLLRMWQYYLAYCEGGFAARHIGLVQLVLDKPACRLAPVVAAPVRAAA